MPILTSVAIIIVMMAVAAGLLYLLKSVFSFFKRRFMLSLWSGALLFMVATSFLVLAMTEGLQEAVSNILVLISAIFFALTIYNDIRLAGLGWGIVAAGLQLLLSFSLIFIIVFAIFFIIARRVFRVSLPFYSFGFGGDIKDEIHSLKHFLRF